MFGQEKRAAPRHKVLKDGKIVTMNHWSVVDCCVKDISESGARIKCQDQAAVPSEFRLLIPTRRTIRDARVVWRQGFVGPAVHCRHHDGARPPVVNPV